MGEWSKSVGEKGEYLLKFLFEEILNFNSLIENQSIDCNNGPKHQISKGPRTTHGLDGIISYVNPLEDSTLDIGIISSKYEGKEYVKYPSSKFKQHLKDLGFAIECFKNSKIKNSINKNFSSINKTEVIGILLWLSNESALDFELAPKIANIQIDEIWGVDKIILIDNNRINFLYESVYASIKSNGLENVDFVYHDTGLNTLSLQKSYFGKTFPMQYLYSDLILLRINTIADVEFHVYINDIFDEFQFTQILNFAKTFDKLTAAKKIVIFYRHYDYLLAENLVKEKLAQFTNYRLNVNLEIRNFPSNFRNK